MAEYIKREWLVNEAEAALDFRKKYYMDIERIKDAASTVEWLKYYAPAADVVEVVRCKDCKHYKKPPYREDDDMMCMCWADWLPTDDNDFCSYGERKDNG